MGTTWRAGGDPVRAAAPGERALGDSASRAARGWGPDWGMIRQLFRFGLPTGFQGIAMNIGGVLLLRFIGSLEQSAEAQAAYAISYTELFSLVTWTSVGLMGATAAVAGQNLGAGHPERAIAGVHAAGADRHRHRGADRVPVRAHPRGAARLHSG